MGDNINWHTYSHVKNMLTNKRYDTKQLEIIFASICRRCFNGMLEEMAKEGVLAQIEI